MFETFRVGVDLRLTGNLDATLARLHRTLDRFNRAVKDSQHGLERLHRGLNGFGGAAGKVDAVTRSMERMHKAASATPTIRAPRVEAAPAAGRAAAAAGGRYGHSRLEGYVAAGELGQAGRSTLALAGDAFGRGMDVEHLRQVLLADRRVTQEDSRRAVESAYQATISAPGTTLAGNTQALIDLKSQLGSLKEAEAALPAIAKTTAVLQTMDAKKGVKSTSAEYLSRALDLLNVLTEDVRNPQTGQIEQKVNPAALASAADKMIAVNVATGGRVDPQMLLNFAKQARTAGMSLSDDFIWKKLPAIMDATGGQRAGTALMSMLQVFSPGGALTNKNFQGWVDAGLAAPGQYVDKVDPRTGKTKREFQRGEIYDLPLMFTDPVAFLEGARKRMQARGLEGTTDQIMALLPASQRATIAGFFADILKDSLSIKRGQENIENVRPDVAQHFAQNDPVAKMQQLQASWDKLLATMGGSAMDRVIEVLDGTTNALNSLGAWARENPASAKILTEVVTVLGGLAVALAGISAATILFGPGLFALGKLGPALGGTATAITGAAEAAAVKIAGAGAGMGLAVAGVATAVALGMTELYGALKRGAESGKAIAHGGIPDAPAKGSVMDNLGMDLPGIPQPAPARPNATLGPRSDARPMNFQGNLVTPDGRVLGQFAAASMARDMNRPRAGMTGVDLRMGVLA